MFISRIRLLNRYRQVEMGNAILSVTHGQCDVKPMVTFGAYIRLYSLCLPTKGWPGSVDLQVQVAGYALKRLPISTLTLSKLTDGDQRAPATPNRHDKTSQLRRLLEGSRDKKIPRDTFSFSSEFRPRPQIFDSQLTLLKHVCFEIHTRFNETVRFTAII